MKSQSVSQNEQLMLASKNSPSLKVGSKGPGVRELQDILRRLGFSLPATFSKAGADGLFGAKTEKAVREFQRKHGLNADGIAGAKTIAKIDDLLGEKPFLDNVSQRTFVADLNSDNAKPLQDRRTYHS